MQSGVLHNKRTAFPRTSEKYTQVSLKEALVMMYNDMIQAIEYFDSTIQQAAWNSNPLVIPWNITFHNDKRKIRN